jgi:hypothetical protein
VSARLPALVGIAIVVALVGGAPRTGSAAAPREPVAVPGELIVGFEARASKADENAVLAQAGADRKRDFPQIHAALVGIPPDRSPAAVDALLRNPHVRYVEPNYVVTATNVPNDPSFGQLWGLHNTGQTGGTVDADIDAPEGWDVTTGSSSVVVAVTDTGVDFGHPDLAAQQWVSPGENCGSSDPTIVCAQRTNGVDDDGNGLIDDWRGWDWVNGDNNPVDDNDHGTHVAGTIGAVGSNGIGVVGVNWNVKIMALKFLNFLGSGTTANAISATLYAASHGARVANNSWGGGAFSQALLDAINQGAGAGMLFVAAAGNDGVDNDAGTFYPATYDADAIVAVAATDHNDTIASFSNFGRTTVDLGAPGASIYSTTRGGSYGFKSGTSMATPHVSGVAALIAAQFPGATVFGGKALLLRSVDPNTSLDGKTTTGGRLNAGSAVACSQTPKVLLAAPGEGFRAAIGQPMQIRVIGANCASPAGLANVGVTVNDNPVTLSASSPDSGLYTGSYTPSAQGALTVTATVTVGGTFSTHSVTGTTVPPPSEPLPTLDDFNRSDENPLSDAGRWSNGVTGSGETGLLVSSNTLACSRTTTCTGWRSNLQYGPDVESWARITTLPGAANAVRLYARLQSPGSTAVDGYMLLFSQASGTDQIALYRITNGALIALRTISQEVAAGDTLLLRAQGPSLEAWRHDGSAWTRLIDLTDSTYAAPGYVGVGLRGTTGRLDDFGGRGLSLNPPDAPTGLTALAGSGTADLSWQPPSFDGGSPITGYKIYRGESPGGEALLASVGTVTSFADSGLTNGTTYYYKVSAVNAVNEGPLSNEASATPADLVPPAEPLPSLDDFNRPDENPLSDAGRWSNGVLGTAETGHLIASNQLACSKATTCTAWRNNVSYGPDTESWARMATLPGDGNAIRLYARLQSPGSSAVGGYMLRANQASGTDQIFLERLDSGAITTRLTIPQDLAAGDTLLLRAQGSTVEAWRHNGAAWSRLGTLADSTYPAAGFAGIGLRGTMGRLDDFGARTVGAPPPPPPPPPEPPGAPTSLVAQGANALVQLTWQPPASDGGSSLTGYNVYRGTSPNGEIFLTSVGLVMSYDDSTVTNGTTYYYKVSAVNAVGEGPLSNEASATPADLVPIPPVEPLPTLDSFNRANENPLSDGGRWTIGVIGVAEVGLRVVSNRLGCNKSTTGTAWRNNASFGPDTESWARITTLPGNGNAVRLYVRLQTPGSAAVDGYMLRFVQASGTDQIFLERFTDGALTTLGTIGQDIAAGDTLLLRAQGSTLEAWRKNGATWTRLGAVTDSTYPGAGYIGVGIRGRTGRLDDFGGR